MSIFEDKKVIFMRKGIGGLALKFLIIMKEFKNKKGEKKKKSIMNVPGKISLSRQKWLKSHRSKVIKTANDKLNQ